MDLEGKLLSKVDSPIVKSLSESLGLIVCPDLPVPDRSSSSDLKIKCYGLPVPLSIRQEILLMPCFESQGSESGKAKKQELGPPKPLHPFQYIWPGSIQVLFFYQLSHNEAKAKSIKSFF